MLYFWVHEFGALCQSPSLFAPRSRPFLSSPAADSPALLSLSLSLFALVALPCAGGMYMLYSFWPRVEHGTHASTQDGRRDSKMQSHPLVVTVHGNANGTGSHANTPNPTGGRLKINQAPSTH